MVRLAKYSVLLAFASVLASPALAQPIQFNFNVTPAANSADWTPLKNQKLEKEVICYFSNDAAQPKVFNAGNANTFRAKETLFETPNTLSLTPSGTAPAQAKSLVCVARILANGQDVSASAHQIIFAQISGSSVKGPLNAAVRLDPAKVAQVTKEQNKLTQTPQPNSLPKADIPELKKKADNTPSAKDAQVKTAPIAKPKLTIAEVGFAGTSIKTSESKGSIKIFSAELEKTSADAVKQKFPGKQSACIDVGAGKSKKDCTVRIQLVVKRSNTIGELKVRIAGKLGTVTTTEDTVHAIFAAGADTITVTTFHTLNGGIGAVGGKGLCGTYLFQATAEPQSSLAETGTFVAQICVGN